MTVFFLLFVPAGLLYLMYSLELPPFFHRPLDTAVPSAAQLVREYEELQNNSPSELVVCASCFKEVVVQDYETLKALSAFTEEKIDGGTNYRCPRCRRVIFEQSDKGKLEFGI